MPKFYIRTKIDPDGLGPIPIPFDRGFDVLYGEYSGAKSQFKGSGISSQSFDTEEAMEGYLKSHGFSEYTIVFPDRVKSETRKITKEKKSDQKEIKTDKQDSSPEVSHGGVTLIFQRQIVKKEDKYTQIQRVEINRKKYKAPESSPDPLKTEQRHILPFQWLKKAFQVNLQSREYKDVFRELGGTGDPNPEKTAKVIDEHFEKILNHKNNYFYGDKIENAARGWLQKELDEKQSIQTPFSIKIPTAHQKWFVERSSCLIRDFIKIDRIFVENEVNRLKLLQLIIIDNENFSKDQPLDEKGNSIIQIISLFGNNNRRSGSQRIGLMESIQPSGNTDLDNKDEGKEEKNPVIPTTPYASSSSFSVGEKSKGKKHQRDERSSFYDVDDDNPDIHLTGKQNSVSQENPKKQARISSATTTVSNSSSSSSSSSTNSFSSSSSDSALAESSSPKITLRR